MSLPETAQQLDNQNSLSNNRRKIRQILSAYRNSWDIYSELLQNSVDAINRRFRILNDPSFYLYDEFQQNYNLELNPRFTGLIHISIDVPKKKLDILDNGVGIEQRNIERILLPDQSGKVPGKEYGYKGYGLTFAAFASKDFSLKTKYFAGDTETYEIGLSGLFDWTLSETPDFPTTPIPSVSLATSPLEEAYNTHISVTLDDYYSAKYPAIAALDSAFNLLHKPTPSEIEPGRRVDAPGFEFVLRTKTAIGNTRHLFSKSPIVPIKIRLDITFANNVHSSVEIPYQFFHPRLHKEIQFRSFTFADYIQKYTQPTFNKIFRELYHIVPDEIIGKQRDKKIRCDFALSVIAASKLSTIAEQLGLKGESSETMVDVDLSPGVYLSIDGMPTGISLDDWDKGGSFLKRYFVITDVELSTSEQLDPGRKQISEHFAHLISNRARELFSEVVVPGSNYSISHYAGAHLDWGKRPSVLTSVAFAEKLEFIREEIANQEKNQSVLLAKLRKYSSMVKIPIEEQEVIALFYSLLQQGIIKGYKTLYLSSAAVYDAAFDYEIEINEDNIFSSTDPLKTLGVGQLLVSDLRGRKEKITKYVHSKYYKGKSNEPELCVEFKLSVGNLVDELLNRMSVSQKASDVLDILVCWDSQISPSTSPINYSLELIDEQTRIYHGTTHKLTIAAQSSNEIHCIVLKNIIELLP